MAPSIDSAMRRLDGVAHIQDLLNVGFSRYQIAAMTHQGELVRPRIGWYVAPWHQPEVVSAVRVGGKLTCVSAARSFGLPVPIDRRVHVALQPNASRLRGAATGRRVEAGADPSVVWHWGKTDAGPSRFRVEPLEALLTASRCVPAEWFVGMVDAARRPRPGGPLLPRTALEKLGERIGEDRRWLVSMSDPAAESVLESLMRFGLVQAGIPAAAQVPIGPYRVDFLIDDWLAIECDGSEHHSGHHEFEQDRRRDADVAGRGYRVLRFSYRQIVYDWPRVLHTIRTVLDSRR